MNERAPAPSGRRFDAKIARQFDADMEAQAINCRAGLHPPGAREIRGGKLYCTACGRTVRP